MTEAELLAATYTDSCTVYRRGQGENPETHQTEQWETTAVENLSCAISLNKGGNLTMDGPYGTAVGSYTLFCVPDANLQIGDRLEVRTAAGQRFVLWAGRPFAYGGSHMETPLTEEDRRDL